MPNIKRWSKENRWGDHRPDYCFTQESRFPRPILVPPPLISEILFVNRFQLSIRPTLFNFISLNKHGHQNQLQSSPRTNRTTVILLLFSNNNIQSQPYRPVGNFNYQPGQPYNPTTFENSASTPSGPWYLNPQNNPLPNQDYNGTRKKLITQKDRLWQSKEKKWRWKKSLDPNFKKCIMQAFHSTKK